MITKGTRVKTADGHGTVEYVRMAAPKFDYVESVSVILDSRRGQPGYHGNVYSAQWVYEDQSMPTDPSGNLAEQRETALRILDEYHKPHPDFERLADMGRDLAMLARLYSAAFVDAVYIATMIPELMRPLPLIRRTKEGGVSIVQH